MGLFRVLDDGTYEPLGITLSDAVTGYWAFRTVSPASNPRPYTVTLHRDHAEGNYNGKNDEDQYPISTLVQGHEV